MYKITTLIYVNEGPGMANSRKCSQRKAILVVKLADLDISLKNQLHKRCNFLDLNLLQETFMTFSLHSRYSRRVLSKKNQIFNFLYVPPLEQCARRENKKWIKEGLYPIVYLQPSSELREGNQDHTTNDQHPCRKTFLVIMLVR